MADIRENTIGDEFVIGGNGAGANGSGANDGWIRDTIPQAFVQDVLEASMEVPVLVDFWGPSCAPCQQLTPILEKVVTEARGAVRLVKMNVEAYPEVAQQLRITSIPAVMVFRDGRPVDGFLGAVPESQVKELVRRHAGELPKQPSDTAVEAGEAALAAGDAAEAARCFAEALQANPQEVRAIGGLARAHVMTGDLEQARRVLEMAETVKGEDAEHESMVAARAALTVAEKSASVGSLAEMERRVADDPDDHAARFDLALALHGARRRGDAVARLLEIVARAPQWNEQAARKQLLELFEAYGHDTGVVIEGRKRLSALLFR